MTGFLGDPPGDYPTETRWPETGDRNRGPKAEALSVGGCRLGRRRWPPNLVSVDPAFTWDQPKTAVPRLRRDAGPPAPTPGRGRIPLREAEHRFGIAVATLRTWARKGSVDAVMVDSEGARQWMVTPESVAHHISRSGAQARRATPSSARATTGPTGDGTAMLVPRDAWDRLIDQLGNLHEAGLMLAEARERAARAETEAGFLRERLGELRAERDELKTRTVAPVAASRQRRRWWGRPGRPAGP